MKKNIITTTGISILALSAGLGIVAHAQSGPAPQITVNGQILRTEAGAFTQNGRVLVPMRDIFESLGAQVNYNNLSREIAAQRGTTIVRMTLGSNQATVNNVPVVLQSAAQTFGGRTYVPLRFVSEAMGASVNYNAPQQLVSISGQGYMGNGTVVAGNSIGGSQVGGISQISVPANAVVKVTLDQDLSSATAYVGQTFTATVVSQQNGDSEFPAGTKLMGEVVGVSKMQNSNPGTLDLRWTRAALPGNQMVSLDGTLIGLDNDSVQQVGTGRIEAKGNGKSSKDTLKVVGIGAGAGFLLGRVLKQNSTLSAVLGAAGGYLYDKSKNKNKSADARLAAGTELGVRLRDSVSYRDNTGYSTVRGSYLRM